MATRISRNRLKHGIMSGAALTALMTGPAIAEPIQFSVPPGSLSKALTDFSRQSDREILVSSELVTGKQSNGLKGTYEPEEALSALISNAGLSYRVTPSDVFLIDASAVETAPQQDITDESSLQSDSVVQTAEAAPEERREQTIVVVGSHIQGARTTDALPVTLIGQEQLAAIGADSGDDLFRSIPQMGDVTFNSTYLPQSSNAARGDVGSVNLRNLGIGNTLVLLNGRRVVLHPTSRANENLVPVLTYNTNAIPTAGVSRIEVLRDGAAAIYGADAVAGVVNTVLREVNNGGDITIQYGGAEDTDLRQLDVNGTFGTDFADGRGNISLFLGYTDRSDLSSTDQSWTATADRRSFFTGTDFEGVSTLDRTSTISGWGNFATVGTGTVRQNGVALTTGAGAFSIIPSANGNCVAAVSDDVCLRSGNRATTGADRNTRYDTNAVGTTLMPEVERINLFSTFRYDMPNGMQTFGEIGYYFAETSALQQSPTMLSSARITVPTSNYWNPFGPETFADGTANPNRLPGLNISPDGAAVTLTSYRFDDFGLSNVNVENHQFRFLTGLRGEMGAFDWESAWLYSRATVRDEQDGVSSSRLQEALSWSTPDAYNPFNGGNPADPSGLDTSLSNAAALDYARIRTERYSRTSLAQWDFKLSRPDLFTLPGGDVGMATGLELRRDLQLDDRDKHVDGTITFTDSVTGVEVLSDLVGTSDTPDTKGSRTVGSAFIEFAVPLVSPEMNIPLVQSLEMQAAGRYENYSDFGDIAKPKIALSWTVIDSLRFRGSWAQSFRAPNLEQLNATVVSRSNTRTDWVRCAPDVINGVTEDFTQCNGFGFATTGRRAGNPDLEAETADTWTVGAVLQPRILPDHFGSLTLTADLWNVEQEGLIGIYGEGNALILDYLLRTQGSSNPDVIRAAPTADEIAAFAGTGLEPVGRVLYVNDAYRNLQPQTVRGVDFSASLALDETPIGRFTFDVNVAHLLEYERSPSPDIQVLLDARAAGQIDPGTIIPEGGDLLRQDGSPRWKWNASMTWKPTDAITIGAYTQYTGYFWDTSILNSQGDNWRVDDQQTVNLYAQYAFEEGIAQNTRVRLGVRNVGDQLPPMDSSSTGYNGALYQPYGRYWYASIRKSF
ncbi:MAG: TonB-dependent receptor [Alphaproteobacteria bacterium HGW-Alphaproteobacteria-18]|nr:MAG: TonB-dependent receptor [Alphaproteobacteria bacterium HGW-Alphaproteobacteria-18]